MFPNFLGVGFYRCGTTWLHNTLASHPRCYMPERMKEVHYFWPDRFQRGPSWYASFFPPDEAADEYDAVGEIGPGYVNKGAIDRIAEAGYVDRCLFMIRCHADRAYSAYRFLARTWSDVPSFEENEQIDEAWARSVAYAPSIRAFRERFGADRVLVAVLEHVEQDERRERDRIAKFLGLDPAGFTNDVLGSIDRNASTMPRSPRLFRAATRMNSFLLTHNCGGLSMWLKDLGLKRLMGFGKGKPLPAMLPETRARISELVASDTQELEQLLGINLDAWRDESTRMSTATSCD